MKTLFTLFFFSSITWAGYRIYNNVTANQTYIGYLERAARANSVELARNQLFLALRVIEREELTSGYTSIIYRTPSEDVGFWYTNLRAALAELDSVPKTSSPFEKSVLLTKIRGTLLTHGTFGDKVIYPKGISVYSTNTAVALWIILSICLCFITGILSDDK